MVLKQMKRWRNLIDLSGKHKFENLHCFGCRGHGTIACKHCAIIVCIGCLVKYSTHKDIKIIGVKI